MSSGLTWRAAALVVALAGCSPLAEETQRGLRSLALFGGEISVAGPEGYCVDGVASRPRDGFVVLAGCARVSDTKLAPDLDGLVTVQLGGPASASVTGAEDDLVALLKANGATVLSADPSRPAEVHSVTSRNAVVLVHLTDPAAEPMPGTSEAEWRAFLDIKGRMATVGLRSFDEAPIDTDEGLRLVAAVAALLIERNAGAATGG